MITERDRWSLDFGAQFAGSIREEFAVESANAWRLGRYVVRVDAENVAPDSVSILAVEAPHEAGCRPENADTKRFEYFLENEPYVAGQMVIRWIKSR